MFAKKAALARGYAAAAGPVAGPAAAPSRLAPRLLFPRQAPAAGAGEAAMDVDTVIGLGREAVEVALLLSGPLLIVGLVVGVAVSLLQALTQVQEMTLSFVPKLLATCLVMVALMPWMARVMIDYTTRLFTAMPGLIRG